MIVGIVAHVYMGDGVTIAITDGQIREAIKTLQAVESMNAHALRKFNWGASALDALAITQLNTIPTRVTALLNELGRFPSDFTHEGIRKTCTDGLCTRYRATIADRCWCSKQST